MTWLGLIPELAETARLVQSAGGRRVAGNPGFWGYVWQGRAWIASNGDGTIDNPQAQKALARAANFVGAISPPCRKRSRRQPCSTAPGFSRCCDESSCR